MKHLEFSLTASVKVTNTGNIAFPTTSELTHPPLQLKGFVKVYDLGPGNSKTDREYNWTSMRYLLALCVSLDRLCKAIFIWRGHRCSFADFLSGRTMILLRGFHKMVYQNLWYDKCVQLILQNILG